MEYFVLAFYQIAPIDDPMGEVLRHKEYLSKKDAKSRIYISEEGINGQMSLIKDDAMKYIDWMHSREEFKNVSFKLHEYHEHAFPKLTIKRRKQLVAFDKKVDFSLKGQHISPQEFKRVLDEEEHVLLDVRNNYEWKVGRFAGAVVPPCETFREFDQWAEDLKKEVDPKKSKVMMYCTGGIRCEYYSSLLKESGFDNVFQLDGGVIQYGLDEGSKHWEGKLFVFDDRLTVPISEEPTPVIGTCHICKTPIEAYYNCANIECNELFLCCKPCLETHSGCCGTECMSAPRLRPYELQNAHKPFRKWNQYSDQANPLTSLPK